MYQWGVALEEGEESGEELPDPPACNAPAPKAAADGDEGEDEEDENEGEGDEGNKRGTEAWSGEDEDLIDSAEKVIQCLLDIQLSWQVKITNACLWCKNVRYV